ncbi:MAG TPA: type I DNA topoisomerase [Sedimentisphaerales bacterium]|nr:type I DNA topoisomerase [Sedimentisphaerales bacterium]
MAKTISGKKSLVIVESPAKSKTINKYLGPGFEVMASMGHVRDLPSKGLSVDIENNFEPTYEISKGKARTVTSLKAAAKKCDKLYLATDLDREGEAIAWHLAQILDFPEENTYRVVFNSITKSAIETAFAAPGKLKINTVMAQQARRILDRIVGYKISPLLWKKVARGLSAGRVQSVAVKMVVDKEREIRAFVPEEYWLIPAVFSTDLKNSYTQQWLEFIAPDDKGKAATLEQQIEWLAKRNAFKAELYKIGEENFQAKNQQQSEKIFNALKNSKFSLSDLSIKESTSRASAPFITSTLQQAAANRLGFATKRTMMVAQQLYEGIDLGSKGSLGLITYMRTDSKHISAEAIRDVRNFIDKSFGKEYLPEEPNYYSSAKNAQQAHEASRVTDPSLKPEDIKSFLSDEQYKLYDLIWRRFVACQMMPVRWNVTTLDIKAETTIGPCYYRSTGRILAFDGFTKVWYTSSTEQEFPEVKVGQELAAVDIKNEQHFTKPPARYNEASLVKALEKEGIGRPSTYATIISTIQDRKYVEQIEKKFHSTDLGEVVTDKLNEYFPQIMDIAFTRDMENQLDGIEENNLDWISVLKNFYDPFEKNLITASEGMQHAKSEVTPSDYKCPECGKDMVYRFGKNGKFLSCGDYPTCKYACPCDKDGKMIEQKVSEHVCPNCGKPMVEKSGRFGKFLGCSDYPTCKTIQNVDKDGNVLPPKAPPVSTGVKCYKCKEGELVIRQSKRGPFMGCNKFPKCRTIISIDELEKLKELQKQGVWPPDSFEKADEILGRDKGKKAAKKKPTEKTEAVKKPKATKKNPKAVKSKEEE